MFRFLQRLFDRPLMKLTISQAVGGLVLVAGLTWLWAMTLVSNDKENNPIGLRQQPTADCGAACLYVICKVAKREQSLEYLRTLTKTSNHGTNMYDLKEAAVSLGFEVEPCSLSFGGLCRHIDKPTTYAILHFKTGHFVAAIPGESSTTIRIADNQGVKAVSQTDMQRMYQWDGSALLLKSIPPRKDGPE